MNQDALSPEVITYLTREISATSRPLTAEQLAQIDTVWSDLGHVLGGNYRCDADEWMDLADRANQALTTLLGHLLWRETSV